MRNWYETLWKFLIVSGGRTDSDICSKVIITLKSNTEHFGRENGASCLCRFEVVEI